MFIIFFIHLQATNDQIFESDNDVLDEIDDQTLENGIESNQSENNENPRKDLIETIDSLIDSKIENAKIRSRKSKDSKEE